MGRFRGGADLTGRQPSPRLALTMACVWHGRAAACLRGFFLVALRHGLGETDRGPFAPPEAAAGQDSVNLPALLRLWNEDLGPYL
jgi:hypothetical protein